MLEETLFRRLIYKPFLRLPYSNCSKEFNVAVKYVRRELRSMTEADRTNVIAVMKKVLH
jgi:hypothetical protein